MGCLIGDCVVAVDDVPVISTRDFSDRVTKSLKNTKISILTLERPIGPIAIQAVRVALLAEKTVLIDPHLAQDASQIGVDEAKLIQNGQVPAPGKRLV